MGTSWGIGSGDRILSDIGHIGRMWDIGVLTTTASTGAMGSIGNGTILGIILTILTILGIILTCGGIVGIVCIATILAPL